MFLWKGEAIHSTKGGSKHFKAVFETCKPQPNDRNIVGRNMLSAFGHRVAMCCDMLGVFGSSLKMVKFEPT